MVSFSITHNGEAKNIPVHKAAACSCSPVFDAAFNSEFIEGETQTYILEDTTLDVFTLLTEYMYNRTVSVQQLMNDYIPDEKRVLEESQETLNLLKLWVLADRFCMPRLQNLVISKIAKVISKSGKLSKLWLDYVYAETPYGSPLRTLFSKIGMTLSSAFIEMAAEWFPPGYLVAVTKELLGRSTFNFQRDIDKSELLVPED